MSLVKITYNLPKEIEERYPNVTLTTGFLDENEWPDIEDSSLFKYLELGNYSDNEIENLVVSILKYIVYLIDERIIKPAYVPGSETLVLNHRDNDDYYLATSYSGHTFEWLDGDTNKSIFALLSFILGVSVIGICILYITTH